MRANDPYLVALSFFLIRSLTVPTPRFVRMPVPSKMKYFADPKEVIVHRVDNINFYWIKIRQIKQN